MSKIRLYGATSGYIDLAAPAVADDATLTLPTGAAGFGKVLQVVQTVKTNTFTTTSASFVDVTGLSASITPNFSTSKILIMVQVTYGLSDGDAPAAIFRLTGGNSANYVGDASASRARGVFGGYHDDQQRYATYSGSITYLDSPATTSSTTYQVQVGGGTSSAQISVNRSQTDLDSANNARGASSITVMEIGA